MRQSQLYRPALHPAAVEAVLTAMRAGQSIGDHPLRYFLVIKDRVNTPHALGGETAVEVAIFDDLTERILAHLTASRDDFGLPAPDPACSDMLLEEDFQKNNQALEAWSLLYHRYICIQRDLLMKDIATRVNQTVRTLRRRLDFGIAALTYELIRAEQDARRNQAERRLRLSLPSTHPPPLINQDELLPPVLHFIEHGQSPLHIVLHGPAGCGKTAIAEAVAHDLVARRVLDDLVWIDCNEFAPAASDIFLEIAHSVGVPLDSSGTVVGALRAYLFRFNVLVVLDSAEVVLRDARIAEDVLAALESAQVLLTSRSGMPGYLWYYEVNIPPLNRHQAFALLEHLALRSSPANRNWDEHFDAIWTAVGGNPLAIKTVWAASRNMPLDVVLADSHIQHVYNRIWDQLGEDERRLWVLSLLFPRTAIPRDALIAVSGLCERCANRSLLHLVDAVLLEVHDHEQWLYRLEPVCVTFLSDLVRQNSRLADNDSVVGVLQSGIQAYSCQLLDKPKPKSALHLVSMIADFGLDVAHHWEIVQDLSTQIMADGCWAMWSNVLVKLAGHTLLPEQHAWIDKMQGIAQRWLGHLDSARDYLERALIAYPEDTAEYMDCLVELSVVQRYQGQWEVARHQLQEAHAFYEQHTDVQGVARCVHELGQLALEAGFPEQALAWLGRLSDWTAGDWGLTSQAYLVLEQYDRALEAAEHALEMLPQQHPNYARTLVTVGQIFNQRQEPAVAARYLSAAVNALDQCKDALGYARASNNLAVAYIHLRGKKQHHDGVDIDQDICRLLRHAQDIQQHSGDELGLAVTRQNLKWLDELGLCNKYEQPAR